MTAGQLADALGCFWNAALGAQARGSTDVGCIAEGVQAVATRLTELDGPPETDAQAVARCLRPVLGVSATGALKAHMDLIRDLVMRPTDERLAAVEASARTFMELPDRWAQCPETDTPCRTCPTRRIPCEAATQPPQTGETNGQHGMDSASSLALAGRRDVDCVGLDKTLATQPPAGEPGAYSVESDGGRKHRLRRSLKEANDDAARLEKFVAESPGLGVTNIVVRPLFYTAPHPG